MPGQGARPFVRRSLPEPRKVRDAGRLGNVPRLDDGSAARGSGRPLRSVWATLTVEEAQELLETLTLWAQDLAAAEPDLQGHTHVSDADGNELTIAIEPDEG
jgi:hypothetical protein